VLLDMDGCYASEVPFTLQTLVAFYVPPGLKVKQYHYRPGQALRVPGG